MRIRIFRAHTLVEAMTQIRSELGPDALILSDRSREGYVEVTAALETSETPELRAPAPQRARPDDLEPFSIPPGRPTMPAPLPREPVLEAALAWHGLSPELITALATDPLEQACARIFRFANLNLAAQERPLLLAGPPGSGKTLTVARLATRLVLAGQQPMVITADGQRAGAVEQLAAFTRLLGLTLVAADTPAILSKALERRTGGQPVLIDAPGLDLDDRIQAGILRALLAASGAAVALVLPCGLDPSEAREIAGAHAELGAQALVATRTDPARRLGGVLSAAVSANLALSEAGIGSAAVDSLVSFTPAFLAGRLKQGAPHSGSQVSARASASAQTGTRHNGGPLSSSSVLSLHIAAQRRAASSP